MNVANIIDILYFEKIDFSIKSDDLNILYLNIRSLRHKLNDLNVLLNSFSFKVHILVLSEIWIYSNENLYFNLPNFTAYFCNRDEKRSGGCAIYVCDEIISSLVFEKHFLNNSILCVNLPQLNINIFGVYKDGKSSPDAFVSVLEVLLSKYKNSVFVGDFNMNLQDDDDVDVVNYSNAVLSNGFLFLSSPVISTRITDTTKSCIDHMFTDLFCNKYQMSVTDTNLSDHQQIILNCGFNLKSKSNNIPVVKILDYENVKKYSLPLVKNSNSVSQFIATSQAAISKSTKFLSSGASNNKNLWFDKTIKSFIKTRDTFYRFKKKYPRNRYYHQEFIYYRNKVDYLVSRAKLTFYETRFIENSSNPKGFWNIVNELVFNRTNSKPKSVEAISHDNQIIYDQLEIADIFNNYFINVVPPVGIEAEDSIKNLELPYNIIVRSNFEETDEAEIALIIKNLNSKASNGYDGISCKFLQYFSSDVSSKLAIFINEMLRTGIFPDELKIAKTIPIFKSGDKLLVKNHRPVSVLTANSKVFETVMLRRFNSHLINNRIMSERQFGFIVNSSTTAACVNLVSRILTHLDDGQMVSALFIDISKAFDSICHDLLLKKLELIGICGPNLDIFKSYLKDRQQMVEINGKKSSFKSVHIGVPQGSILGPTLFNFYINDVCSLPLKGVIQLYADDMAIIYNQTNNCDLEVDMQHDLELLNYWFDKNFLKVNVNKTVYMRFSLRSHPSELINDLSLQLNGTRIIRVVSTRYLGLIIDESLKWHEHINYIRSKISPLTFAFRRSKEYMSASAKWAVYNGLFLSHVNYMNVLWSQASDYMIRGLQVIQNRMIKLIYDLPHKTSSSCLYRNIMDISKTNMYSILLLIYKFKNNLSKNLKVLKTRSDIHDYPTRNRDDFDVDFRKTELSSKSIYINGLKYFNKLPVAMKSQPKLSKFKIDLKSFLLHNSTAHFDIFK